MGGLWSAGLPDECNKRGCVYWEEPLTTSKEKQVEKEMM